MRVAIIEDEPLSQEELKGLVNRYFPDFEVVKLLASVKESVEWLSEHQVDLLFLDIQLKDGISFEIFDYLRIKTPIIFITAYNEYAIRAFKNNSIDYLLKPIIDEELVNAVSKFQDLNDPQKYLSRINDLIKNPNKQKEYRNRFVLKLGAKLVVVESNNIAYIYSEDKHNYVITNDNRKLIIENTIDSLEQMLDPTRFFKLSRKCIASSPSIKEIIRHFNGKLRIILFPSCDIDIFVSREKVPSFTKWLEQ